MNTDHFLELLGKSGLLSEDQLDDTLALIEPGATAAQLDDAEYVGQKFVEYGLLTPWHVRQLLKRRYKGFFIRQYKILGILGAGGMSTVYLAEHRVMQRRVAIKVLPKERLKKSAYLDHFVREAQVIATLDHPHIIRAYDIDREGDIHYIVMEFFEGTNLQKKVDTEGSLPIPDIVYYVMQAAEALAYAHKVGIIHRDVKPGNLLVNSKKLVKLLDLGLAMIDQRSYSGNISSHFQESSVLGTADYLAPEQAINSRNIDSRADIYALGGVLYFCLTGHSPFPSGSVSERLLAHQQKEPSSILKDRPNTDTELVTICEKMMAKNPDDRYQTAGEIVRVLRNWLRAHGHAKLLVASNEEASDLELDKKPEEKKAETLHEAPDDATDLDSEDVTVSAASVEVKPEEATEVEEVKPEPDPKPEADSTKTARPSLPSLPTLPGIPKPSTSEKGTPPSLPKLPSLPPLPGRTAGRTAGKAPTLPTLPPLPKKTSTEVEEYLAPRTPSVDFGKFDEDTATTSAAGPLIFGDLDGKIDLTEEDYEATATRKTDPDLSPHVEVTPIDASILSPDSSTDLGGKTDIDLLSHPSSQQPLEEPATPLPVIEPVPKAAPKPEAPKPETPKPEVPKPAAPKPEGKVPQPKKPQGAGVPAKSGGKPQGAGVPAKSQKAKPEEKPKSKIVVNEQAPLMAPPARSSELGGAGAAKTVTLQPQEKIVIQPPSSSRDEPAKPKTLITPPESEKPNVFELASDSGSGVIPLQGETQPTAPKAPQKAEKKPAATKPAAPPQKTPPQKTPPQKAAPPKAQKQPVQKPPAPKRDPNKPVDDDAYDQMLTNFVSSTMPVKADEDDPAVHLAVQEMKQQQEQNPHRHRETIEIERRGATTMGIELKTASNRIDEYIEEEKSQTSPKTSQFETATNWLAMVPVWFWAIFGFIAALAFVFGFMIIFKLG